MTLSWLHSSRVELYLKAGELWELENRTTRFDYLDENKAALGSMYYLWRFYVKAVLGDYRQADLQLEELEKISAKFEPDTRKLQAVHALDAAAAYLAYTQPFLANPTLWLFEVKQREYDGFTNFWLSRADQTLMRGLMALEVGDTVRARSHFETVMAAVNRESRLRFFFPEYKIAEKYLELLNE